MLLFVSPFLGHSTDANSKNKQTASFLKRTFPISPESVSSLWRQL